MWPKTRQLILRRPGTKPFSHLHRSRLPAPLPAPVKRCPGPCRHPGKGPSAPGGSEHGLGSHPKDTPREHQYGEGPPRRALSNLHCCSLSPVNELTPRIMFNELSYSLQKSPADAQCCVRFCCVANVFMFFPSLVITISGRPSVLYSRALLFVCPGFTSLHLLTPSSASFPSPHSPSLPKSVLYVPDSVS